MKNNITDYEKDIIAVLKNIIIYKILYKITLFNFRKKFKQKYKFYKRILETIQSRINQ